MTRPTDGDADVFAITGSDDRDFIRLTTPSGNANGADNGNGRALGAAEVNGNSDNERLDIEVNQGGSTRLHLSSIERITVTTGGGDDFVVANELASKALLTVDTGDGDDLILGSTRGDTLQGGAGDDEIDGNQGADLVLGGDGDDTLTWDAGDGSDILDGGAGLDTHVFNTSNDAEQINLFGREGHAILTRDVGAVTMDIDNVERVVIGASGAGADRIVIGDLSGTDVQEVRVEFHQFFKVPDGAADVVAVNGTGGDDLMRFRIIGNTTTELSGGIGIDGLGPKIVVTQDKDEALDRVEVNAGSGVDVVTIDGAAGSDFYTLSGAATADGRGDQLNITLNSHGGFATLINVETISVSSGDGNDNVDASALTTRSSFQVDGGAGQDNIRGSTGADILAGGLGDDTIDGNQGVDVMLGGDGNDALIWDPGDGSDTLDGGAGFDTHVFNTSSGDEVMTLGAGADGHAILTRNLGGIRMDIDNVERIVIGGGGGADRIAIGDLAGTDVTEVRVGGGAGPDQFVFSTAGVATTIVDFAVHSGGAVDADVIRLLGSSDASFEAALSNGHIVQSGADVVISDASGVIVTLQDIQVGALQASDFLFG